MANTIRFFTILSLLACALLAFAQEAGPEEKGKAVVYFYREARFVGSGARVPFYVDNVEMADLVGGRYFRTTLKPGKHVFRCTKSRRGRTEEIQVQTAPNQEYYLRAEFLQPSIAKSYWHILLTTKEQGEADIQRLKPLQGKIVPQ